jgi:hypothetical protein
MKLTKSKLKQIIKEELQKITETDYLPPPGSEFDTENYPTTPEELESNMIAQQLEDAWAAAGNSGKRLSWDVEDKILNMAIAVRDGSLEIEDALEQVEVLKSSKYA